MKSNFLTRLGLAGALLLSATACEKDLLDQVNPNLPTTESFFNNGDDAVKASTAAYAGLQGLGMYRRWLNFAFDLRDDTGFSQSPWGELADFTGFVQPNYNFEVSRDIYRDHYRTIYRANQIIVSVPGIAGMEAGLQKRVVGEAKFLRALSYFNLVSLYGNVPLTLAPSADLNVLPRQGTEAEVWTLIIKDLQEAQADLPLRYSGNDLGRATKGAALTLLGKAYMQNKRWAEAEAQFAQVISSGVYSLTPSYTDNFRHTSENNSESIFEVQFSDEKKGGNDAGGGPDATSSQGGQRSQFWGVPGAGFNDGELRPWVVNEFLKEGTAAGQRDPRLAATAFYDRFNVALFPTALPVDDDRKVYGGQNFEVRYTDARTRSRIFYRKYATDYYRNFEDFDSPINQRVMRYADVLLLQAEAKNEQGKADLLPLVNQVRQRAGLTPLLAMSQAAMREQLRHERITELTGEGVRWFDLQRYGVLDTQAEVDKLKARDPSFSTFRPRISRLLPLIQTDVDLLSLKQNEGY